MKTLDKKEMKNVIGGLACVVNNDGTTTTCFNTSKDGKTFCAGTYSFSGETLQLFCRPSDKPGAWVDMC